MLILKSRRGSASDILNKNGLFGRNFSRKLIILRAHPETRTVISGHRDTNLSLIYCRTNSLIFSRPNAARAF